MSRNPLARSALVGVAASVLDLLVLGVLVDGFGVPPAWANMPALTLGIVVQFVGNKYLAFGDRSDRYMRQGGLFVAVEAFAFALNAGLFHLLGPMLALPWWAARVLASAGVYFGFSYPLWVRIFTTSTKEARS